MNDVQGDKVEKFLLSLLRLGGVQSDILCRGRWKKTQGTRDLCSHIPEQECSQVTLHLQLNP